MRISGHFSQARGLLSAIAVIAGLLLSACSSGSTATPTSTGEARSLTGAGATFPAPLYTKWFDSYQKLTNVQVSYTPNGSGAGITAISDQTIDFGASDAPMTDDQLKAAKGGAILHIPMTLGAVVATYNIPNFSDTLKLTPDTLSGIYLGDIAKWNDPKLVADNPGLANIDQNITVVHRSDGSGTTNIFTDYLSNVNPTWKQNVGMGTSVKWPVDAMGRGIGAPGSAGVSGEVVKDPNSIGYVELTYATQNKLGVAQIKNQAGSFIQPSTDSVTAAAAGAISKIPSDLRASIVNASGANSYPISGFTWQLVYQNIPDKAKATALARLLWWETHQGQSVGSDLGYAPLPAEVVKLAEDKITSITTNDQRALPQ